jgi:hypothetical protein
MGGCTVTTVKLSLEGFARKDSCGEAAVARLREAVIQMDELLRETWHLMHLDMRARFEAALKEGLEPDEQPWTVQRLRNYLCAAGGLRWTRDYNAALNLKHHDHWPDRRPPESAAAGGGGAVDQA